MNRLARTTITLTAAALLTLGAATPAFADTTSDTGATSTTTSVQPGHLSIDGSPARPGQTVTFSGTCASSDGTDPVTVGSVSSSAFSSVSMDRTNPDAFDGTATIASGATPGAHTVTARCSNGTASSSVTVAGGHVAPNNGGGGTGGSTGRHTGSSSSSSQVDEQVDTLIDQAGSALPWVLGGLALAGLAGGAAYALGRGRREDREQEADRRARADWEDRQAWQHQQESPYRQGWQGSREPVGPQQYRGPQGPGPRGPMNYR